MTMRAAWVLALLTAGCALAPPWQPLHCGDPQHGWRSSEFGGDGSIAFADDTLELGMGNPLTGVTCTAAIPSGDYELEFEAARRLGNDFFCGLTFPVGDAYLTLILGGWGGALCGFSSLDGLDAARNATRTLRHFPHDAFVRIRLIVTPTGVTAFVDDQPLCSCDPSRHRLSLRPEVELSRPFGVAAFSTAATLRGMRWRPRR
ncbi:MAG: DUF1080 domain-containing protein [Planctomycetes bacterium]|nr:DUF1080 domain-containing protein [Planctomycetota bacterium]